MLSVLIALTSINRKQNGEIYYLLDLLSILMDLD